MARWEGQDSFSRHLDSNGSFYYSAMYSNRRARHGPYVIDAFMAIERQRRSFSRVSCSRKAGMHNSTEWETAKQSTAFKRMGSWQQVSWLTKFQIKRKTELFPDPRSGLHIGTLEHQIIRQTYCALLADFTEAIAFAGSPARGKVGRSIAARAP